jgi:hypothetical protein
MSAACQATALRKLAEVCTRLVHSTGVSQSCLLLASAEARAAFPARVLEESLRQALETQAREEREASSRRGATGVEAYWAAGKAGEALRREAVAAALAGGGSGSALLCAPAVMAVCVALGVRVDSLQEAVADVLLVLGS